MGKSQTEAPDRRSPAGLPRLHGAPWLSTLLPFEVLLASLNFSDPFRPVDL